MTRFMIWWCLCWCIASMIAAPYYAYRGDYYGVVISLCLSVLYALYGYSFCRDRDAERKRKEKE